MKLYAPKYYSRFKCIADKCEHSCCVGWEIDIDSKSLAMYKGLEGGYGEVIKDSIVYYDTPHFRLGLHDRCPHLNERGLCKIITHLGEDYLCDICREHPRFYNYTDVAEVGIGMSCPEAARIILSSPDYMLVEEVGEVEGEPQDFAFDSLAERSHLYDLLADSTANYKDKIKTICQYYSLNVPEDDDWLQKLANIEYLDMAHKALFMRYSSQERSKGHDIYLERFLAYLIYRHTTEAPDREDFVLRLRFCLGLAQLLASLTCHRGAKTLEDIALLAQIISEEIEYSEDNTFTFIYE